MEIKILVAEDDQLFRELVCDILKKQEYVPIEARDGQEALDIFFSSKEIDLILLDVMMPKYNGWEVLREIREHSEVPIIMLTALEDEKYEVSGFRKGADDYITKPFSYEVFIARINRFLNRLKKERESELIIGNITINQAAHKVIISDEEIELNRKEYSLLLYLIKNKGLVLSREQILDNVWGYDFEGDIRTIDTHIKMLRSKRVELNQFIKTIRGSGYMFEVEKDENN